MPEKLARSVVVTPCCRHHSLTERPLLRHSWICAAHSCSSARCFNSALVILTPHNTTVAKPFATFRYYCLMCVYARLGLTVTIFASLRRYRARYIALSFHHLHQISDRSLHSEYFPESRKHRQWRCFSFFAHFAAVLFGLCSSARLTTHRWSVQAAQVKKAFVSSQKRSGWRWYVTSHAAVHTSASATRLQE